MFDEKLHRQAAANIDFRRGENVGKHKKKSFLSYFVDYPQDCLPQNCLLEGNPEVGNFECINHQDCLP